ncbi:hypothetical protein GCM10011390_49410 [Aureimonas endophytica]|uniref:HTH cro/C1-type domain-containing protein n=1 Tax=Aureimonas endophytica TaxID=2027858 RepID=A0A917A440_9HYPH|nr:hypothetical protein [Aureimonas endophytica]GGE24116.1 hypothetical protein GCM10011390_49410 [Aureimonas endophytica]
MGDMHSIPKTIAEAIEAGISPAKAFRIYSDRSIFELAEAAHVEPRRLCLIEAGLAPTPVEAMALVAALDMPPAFLAHLS